MKSCRALWPLGFFADRFDSCWFNKHRVGVGFYQTTTRDDMIPEGWVIRFDLWWFCFGIAWRTPL